MLWTGAEHEAFGSRESSSRSSSYCSNLFEQRTASSRSGSRSRSRSGSGSRSRSRSRTTASLCASSCECSGGVAASLPHGGGQSSALCGDGFRGDSDTVWCGAPYKETLASATDGAVHSFAGPPLPALAFQEQAAAVPSLPAQPLRHTTTAPATTFVSPPPWPRTTGVPHPAARPSPSYADASAPPATPCLEEVVLLARHRLQPQPQPQPPLQAAGMGVRGPCDNKPRVRAKSRTSRASRSKSRASRKSRSQSRSHSAGCRSTDGMKCTSWSKRRHRAEAAARAQKDKEALEQKARHQEKLQTLLLSFKHSKAAPAHSRELETSAEAAIAQAQHALDKNSMVTSRMRSPEERCGSTARSVSVASRPARSPSPCGSRSHVSPLSSALIAKLDELCDPAADDGHPTADDAAWWRDVYTTH